MEYFGEIKNGVMGLNEMGCLVAKFWQEIPQHFAHVELDEWVVMPNHVHGVLFLNHENTNINTTRRDAINRVSTGKIKNVKTTTGGITGNKNPMGTNALGEIVRWFKGKTTYKIRKIHKPDFTWQPRFYDRIIRNDNELNLIRKYIQNNPYKWEQDRNNPNQLFY